MILFSAELAEQKKIGPPTPAYFLCIVRLLFMAPIESEVKPT